LGIDKDLINKVHAKKKSKKLKNIKLLYNMRHVPIGTLISIKYLEDDQNATDGIK
jgi:hypothetical protein